MKASSILFLGILSAQISASHAMEGRDIAIEQLDPYKTSELNGFGIYQYQVRNRIPEDYYNVEIYSIDSEHLVIRNKQVNEPIYKGSPFWLNMQGRKVYYAIYKNADFKDVNFDFGYYWYALNYIEDKEDGNVYVSDFRFLTDEEKLEHWTFASQCHGEGCTENKAWSQDFIDLISKDVRTSEIF